MKYLFPVALLFALLGSACAGSDKSQNQGNVSSDTENAAEDPAPVEETPDEEDSEEETVSSEPADEVEEETPEEEEEEEEESISCTWNVAPKITGELNLSGGNILTDARIGAQEGFDRFVLEFDSEGSVPESYEIKWVFDNDGGETVFVSDDLHLETEVQGNIALQVKLAGSHWDIVNDVEVYEGPNSFSSSLLGNIIEVKFGGSHAGIILWGIGVDEANGFRILEFTDPPRIAIDICVADLSDKLANCLVAGETWEYPEWLSPDFLNTYCESNFVSS